MWNNEIIENVNMDKNNMHILDIGLSKCFKTNITSHVEHILTGWK